MKRPIRVALIGALAVSLLFSAVAVSASADDSDGGLHKKDLSNVWVRFPNRLPSTGLINGPSGSCAASVLDYGERGNIIMTAAHCVTYDVKAMQDQALFIPSWTNVAPDTLDVGNPDEAPFGAFHVIDLRIDRPKDIAFIKLHGNDQGQSIRDVVGGNVPVFNAIPDGESRAIVAAGYPENGTFNGGVQVVRQSTARRDGSLKVFPCRDLFGHGSSGGPVIQNFDPFSRRGEVIGAINEGASGIEAVLDGTSAGEDLLFDMLDDDDRRMIDELINARIPIYVH